MNIFYDFLNENKNFRRLKDNIHNNITPVLATGVIDTQKTHLISGIEKAEGRNSIIITHSEVKAKEIYKDMCFFAGNNVHYYPSKDIIFYFADVKSVDIIKHRFEILSQLVEGKPATIVLSADALFDKMVSPQVFRSFILEIKPGDILTINELAQRLVFMGYERCDIVEGQGQFAIRGGILDLFSTVSENAVRIEFFDDEVDSIRLLDSMSQRSIEKTDSIKVYPMRELIYTQKEIDAAVKSIQAEFKKIKNPSDRLCQLVNETIEKLTEQKSFFGVEKFMQYFYDKPCNLFDYLPKDTVIYIDEPNRVRDHCEFVYNEFTESASNRIEKGYMLPAQLNMVYTPNDIIHACKSRTAVLMTSVTQAVKDFAPQDIIDFHVRSSSIAKNNIKAASEDLHFLCDRGYRILFLAGGRTRCERIFTELTDYKVRAAIVDSVNDLELEKGIVYVTKGSITNGFEYINDKLAILSDNELFSEERRHRKRAKRKKDRAAAIQSFNDLKVGDYVVHESYGIGIYKGIEQIYSDGVCRDYLKIGYADENILYVDINQLDTIQKYIGGDSVIPKITTLGNNSWTKAKARAKKAAMDIAKDLVELYAARQAAKGYVYGPDTVWQKEFEEGFPFEETDDQLAAIEDVKKDMESGKVMDRLICGDVGFGKTEVAIRAAFKTVQEGKQVAYLVPTTILASQHYSTFKSRMDEYAVRVELLNRFQTSANAKRITADLAEGKVDVVIGTHRLLSKDVKFKDLGLIIVDEEQRFGVTHKEKLKNLKKNANVLTLTATPIPRTLHMSMSGIRDMSLLEEAPNDRLPIQTYVMEYNPEFVRDAILRELARDGQVYFLSNRVQNIENTARTIQALVPNAEVAYAHGQMTKKQLETVMTDFINKDIDVLVCTTIIETGLDISNVNTIIIQDADRMGLSQLYQLRGRVGRSTRSSFAYLMYRKDKVISEVSEKRLQTIREFTEFGSGFRVAMKDLEIRGAGDLLGSAQSGNMDSVGYEMYCKLLDEAVRELKGEATEKDFETLMDLRVNAFIPLKYIGNESQRLEMYKKIALIKNQKDFYNVQEELEDRYGDLPKSVCNLLDVALTKALAHKIGVSKISQRGKNAVIYFNPEFMADGEKILAKVIASNGRLAVAGKKPAPVFTYGLENEINATKELKELFEEII